MTHTCHAHGCPLAVPPKMFMCRGHWAALPKPVQRAVWREYRPGQERDKDPSASYMAVQQFAIGLIAFRPNDEDAAATSGGYILRAAVFRTLAMADGGPDPLRGLTDSPIPDVTLEQARAMVK